MGYVWTEVVSVKKKLRFQLETDTCGPGVSRTLSYTRTYHESGKFQSFHVQIANYQYNPEKGPITCAGKAMLMNSVLPACPVSCLVPPGRPASVIIIIINFIEDINFTDK